MHLYRVVLLVLLALLSTQSRADLSDWSQADRRLLVASEAGLFLDWRQTLDIQSHSNFYESNPVLGRHPSNSLVNLYFATSMAGTYVIADHLDEHRTLFLGGVTLLEVVTVLKNRRLGLSFSF